MVVSIFYKGASVSQSSILVEGPMLLAPNEQLLEVRQELPS